MESPSTDLTATADAAKRADELVTSLLGSSCELVDAGGRVHLRWSGGGDAQLVLVMHVDTVWPLGTLARWPFAIEGDRATGPGAFDMKAGLVQGLHALSLLPDLTGVRVLITTDEEIGSPTSRGLIEETVRGARAALVLEPSAAGALKSARKGVSMYELVVAGRAAHAGHELAHQLIALEAVADATAGTTVTPTLLSAGTTTNTVPARASAAIDVRAVTEDEQQRVDTVLRGLRPVLAGAELELRGGPNRPPLQPSASEELLGRARRLAGELGLPALEDVRVGGGSDGNFTAGVGVPTLDGLGAVGDGAHAEGEYVVVSAMAERAALVAALAAELLGQPIS